MPMQPTMQRDIKDKRTRGVLKPKYGSAIIAGTDYPQDWDGFIGQAQAVEQLRTSVASAKARGARLDHILLASGAHGIGKTTLAQIVAIRMGSGFITVSGPLSVDDARHVMRGMQDGDILFWDEFHLAVNGNRTRADWLLPMLTDHMLLTRAGAEPMPNITVIAATTDVGKLPQTIISRFMIRPRLEYYNDVEGAQICRALATRMKVRMSGDSTFRRIARAANNNPREMRMIITAVRDLAMAGPVDLDKAFDWAGVTHDGLSRECVDILLVLVASPNVTASLETIQAALGEPGPLRHHEQTLIQKGLIVITGRGRALTEDGVSRAIELMQR